METIERQMTDFLKNPNCEYTSEQLIGILIMSTIYKIKTKHMNNNDVGVRQLDFMKNPAKHYTFEESLGILEAYKDFVEKDRNLLRLLYKHGSDCLEHIFREFEEYLRDKVEDIDVAIDECLGK